VGGLLVETSALFENWLSAIWPKYLGGLILPFGHFAQRWRTLDQAEQEVGDSPTVFAVTLPIATIPDNNLVDFHILDRIDLQGRQCPKSFLSSAGSLQLWHRRCNS